MVRFNHAMSVVLLTAILSGCETGTAFDDVDTLWGGGETLEQREQRERLEAALQSRVPIQSISTVEIGRTPTGILVTAYGIAAGSGYSLPELRVRRESALTSDGYIEFDFVASAPPPELNLPQGPTSARAIRADLPIDLDRLDGVRGLRVMALRGSFQVDF